MELQTIEIKIFLLWVCIFKLKEQMFMTKKGFVFVGNKKGRSLININFLRAS